MRLGDSIVGLEAAHIKWHQAGGPCSENNGLALCSLHHKLFDRGVFTLSVGGDVLVSERAHGNSGFEDWLMTFHGKKLVSPQRPSQIPSQNFVKWHNKEVFQGPHRYIE
jgi:putative restriction endonuclease